MAAPHPLLLPLISGAPIPDDAVVDLEVARSASEHYVGALVDQAVTDRHVAFTDDARRRLSMDRLGTLAEYEAAVGTARTVLDVAADLGVRIAMFKGIAWASQWYPDPALRPCIDVDVAIHPDDLPRIGDFLVALGADTATANAAVAMVAEGRVFEIAVAVGPADVDVHRDPLNLVVPATSTDLWGPPAERSIVDTAAGVAETFDLEWSVVIGLLHGLRDNFADLLHVNDLRLMMDAGPDWDRVAAIAEAEGLTDVVRYAIAFVADTLGVPSPLPRRMRRAAHTAATRLWPRSLLLHGADSIVRSERRQSAISLLMEGRSVDRSAAYARRVFPSRQIIDHRFGLVDSAPYPVALYRWRKSQRSTIADNRAAADATTPPEVP